ncbi:hypothetical protein TRVL_06829 [Trypanosoma vivax]|nr:hypothetical protein TRVL_06829 [Trypanosoma vivax]
MAYFTVYHGNNEATMFNADCTTGSLIGRMREMLLPPGKSYSCIELLPLAFVLEQFKLPTKASATSPVSRGAHQQDTFMDQGSLASRGQPFTGNFPFVGLATRPLESRADTFLGHGAGTSLSAATAPSPLPVSASFVGPQNGVGGCSGAAGAITPVQDCYVLLGCCCEPTLPQNGEGSGFGTQRRTSASAARGGSSQISRLPNSTLRRLCGMDASVIDQRLSTLQRAVLVSALPLAPANTSARGSAQQNAHTQISQDTALLLSHSSGITVGDPANLPWRKAFSQYLTTLITPTSSAGTDTTRGRLTPGAGATPSVEQISQSQASQQQLDNTEELFQTAKPLPPAATGLYMTPVPPIVSYDVLWCGARGEHLRLQEALDERLLSDVDAKKKRPKKS